MAAELARWQSHWDPAMRTHPEASHAEYVVVVNSKPYFLAQAAVEGGGGLFRYLFLKIGFGRTNRCILYIRSLTILLGRHRNVYVHDYIARLKCPFPIIREDLEPANTIHMAG